MHTKSTVLTLLLTSVIASAAFAGTGVEPLATEAANMNGAEYLSLEARVAGLDPAALSAKVDAARFDARSWKRDLELVMLQGLTRDRGDLERVQGLAGLDPQVYLKNRRPEPAVAAELKLMKLAPAALFVTYLKTFEVYPFADRSAYPVSLTDQAFAATRVKERDALRQGLIVAIGASGHPAAQHLLGEIMIDQRVDEGTRSLAAVHLGEAGGDVAESKLLALLGSKSSELLKASALSGLGQVRTPSSLRAISTTLKSNSSIDLKKAAVAALGNLGSAWAIKAEGREASTLRSQASALLVDTLLSKDGEGLEPQVLEALTRAGDAAALTRLRDQSGRDAATSARADRAAQRIARALTR